MKKRFKEVKMNKLEHPVNVWYGLQILEYSIFHYAAASAAWDDLKENEKEKVVMDKMNNPYLVTTEYALKMQLITEIAKFFDKEKSKDNVNCSINELRFVLENNDKYKSNKETEAYLNTIDELCKRYESIISKNFRNKTLAHNDLKKLFEDGPVFNTIKYNEVYELVRDIDIFISTVCVVIVGATMKINGFEELKENYKKSLYMILGKE